MKIRSISNLSFLSFILIAACNGGSGGGGGGISTSANIISGVAATGAPISQGQVKIKGRDGDEIETTTNADGSYSATIANLEEPYLVKVIAPSGEKYISVASRSALAAGEKINVTPLSHIIVANVFGSSNADEIFENFESEAAEYSDNKLEDEKNELVQKFIDAGLLGSGKIVDANVDLLRGEFVAGTGDGIDGLLDVISVNTDASAGIEIKLKGESVPLITDKVDGSTDPGIVAIDNTKLNSTKAQLTMLDQLRVRLNALAALHSSKVPCNGDARDDNGSCDIDSLYAAFAPYFHADFKEEGNEREAGIWSWFCRIGDDDDAATRTECLTGSVEFENVSLKDITLIKYDDINKIAFISINIYVNGVLKGSEELVMKYDEDEGAFDLLGNKKTFRYWIETESLHFTRYNKTSNTGTDEYSVNLKFYLEDDKDHNFTGNETLTLSSVAGHAIFPGGLTSMPLYVVVAPEYNEGVCSPSITFSTTDRPYKMVSNGGVESWGSFSEACTAPGSTACNCSSNTGYAYYDYDKAQRMILSATEISKMDKVERISMVGGSVIGDMFMIKKPLIVNEFNASNYIPSIGMTAADYCENLSFTTSLNLSAGASFISYANVHLSFSNANNTEWDYESGEANYWDSSSSTQVFTPTFSKPSVGDIINYSYLYISAHDEFERQFVRNISCEQ